MNCNINELKELATKVTPEELLVVNKQIRESNDPDASLVKALADLTRAYLQLKGGERLRTK